MEPLGTLLVCTVLVDDARVAATWDGGKAMTVFVDTDGRPRRMTIWQMWNHAWGVPLIEPSPDSFERFVLGRLSEPGVVEDLIEAARALA